MQTRALKSLIEISRVGSFAIAAQQLGMTLSALSMQMKSLETELSASLFDRSFRPPKLTALGRTVCEYSETLIEIENRMVEQCRPSGKLIGKFRLGFIATASVRMLPDFLIKAKSMAPDAQFEVETGLSDALEARVLTGQLDAAVVTATPVLNPNLHSQLLRSENLAYVSPTGLHDRAPGDLIKSLPFFHFMPHSGIGKLIAGHTVRFQNQGRGSIVLDSVEAIMECVNKGIGFTLLPEPDIRRYLTKHAQIMPYVGRNMTRDIVLTTLAKSNDTAQMKLIENLLSK